MICRIPISCITLKFGLLFDVESVSDCLKDEPWIKIRLNDETILTGNDVYSTSIDNEYFYIETKIDIYDYLNKNSYLVIYLIGNFDVIDKVAYFNNITDVSISICNSCTAMGV